MRGRAGMAGAVLALALAAWALAPAMWRGQAGAGGFDYYILAISWMPSFCETRDDDRDDPRCAPGEGHGWMLHGLWPQHEDGSWPEFCETAHRNPSRQETAREADLFGVGWAAWHQWNKHGRCSGLSAADYFALSREALGRVTLPETATPPPDGREQGAALTLEALAAAFIAANPAFDPAMLLATCRDGLIQELRLCLSRDLSPRPCDEATRRRACRLDAARMPLPQ